MKTTSLRFRLLLLIAVTFACEAALIYVSVTKSKEVLGNLTHVAELELPATRDLTVADMYHDGLRAQVFSALYYNKVGNHDEVKSITEEAYKMSENFVELIDKIEQMPLSKNTVEQIELVKSDVKAYASMSVAVVERLNSGGGESKDQLEQFNRLFEKLEHSLGALGPVITAEASASHDEGKDIVTIIMIFSAVGITLSLFASFLIFAWIKRSFDSALVSVVASSGVIKDFSSHLEESSEQVNRTTVEQSAAIQESVSALSQMSSMIAQTSQNVRMSLETSQGALIKADEGRQTMDRMSHSMSAIQKSNSQLQEISKVIDDINSKTAVINDIVFKTQLLSFNASIEAARAGQHGRGFAVVAEEVGSLAELSGQAAREIGVLIADSQRRVKETLELIQNRVSDGNRVSQLASQTFTEISQNIDEINRQVKAINEATLQQETGIQQVNIAMRQMDESSQRNAVSASVVYEKSEALKSEANGLGHATAALQVLITGGDALTTTPMDPGSSAPRKVTATGTKPLMETPGSEPKQAKGESAMYLAHDLAKDKTAIVLHPEHGDSDDFKRAV